MAQKRTRSKKTNEDSAVKAFDSEFVGSPDELDIDWGTDSSEPVEKKTRRSAKTKTKSKRSSDDDDRPSKPSRSRSRKTADDSDTRDAEPQGDSVDSETRNSDRGSSEDSGRSERPSRSRGRGRGRSNRSGGDNSNGDSQNQGNSGGSNQRGGRGRRRRGGGGGNNSSGNNKNYRGNSGNKNRNGGGNNNRKRHSAPVEFDDVELVEGVGMLEMHPNGYGFLRSPANNFSRERSDPFVPGTMIEKFGLRAGVLINAKVQPARRQQGPRVRELIDVDGLSLIHI